MKNKFKNIIASSLIVQIIVLKWLSSYPELIEAYFSKGVYLYLSLFFRFLFGWIPFSIGDILYASLGILAMRYFIVKRKYILKNPLNFLRNILVIVSVAYFTFNVAWGLNYYREPIAKSLGIEQKHDQAALILFAEKLITKTNETQVTITGDSTIMVKIPYTNREIFAKTLEGYNTLKKIHPSLNYKQPSLKESLFSTPLSYAGYGGYLNPFTNEAQVNGLMPTFSLPVVSGHEVGHQLGYSAENETNLIGYLVSIHNEDIYFKYAAYAYALQYCLSNLKGNDENTFQKLLPKINMGIRKNYQEINDFWRRYENVTEPVFQAVFNSFLKANHQEDGIKSYSKVVLLMVGYHQKYSL